MVDLELDNEMKLVGEISDRVADLTSSCKLSSANHCTCVFPDKAQLHIELLGLIARQGLKI